MTETRPPKSRIRRLVKVVLLAVAVFTLGVAVAGLGYQALGTWRDAHRFRQRGRLVQAGSVKLNLDCSGQGNPTVILDSGSGIPAIGWINVQPEVAKFTRVCSYDRAGYGWSEPGPEPRTSLQIAKELKMLLDAAGEKGPYLLVGHSFGGFNVRVFTGQYPSEVAGVVLIDASREDEEDVLEGKLSAVQREQSRKEEARAEERDEILTPFEVYFGIQRLSFVFGSDSPNYLSKDLRQELFYLQQQRKSRNALASEGSAYAQSVVQVRAAGNLGDLPLVVLAAAYNNDPSVTDEQRNLWTSVLQVENAKLSTRGKELVVQDTGHMIPFERPDAVFDAIREVWSDASNR